MIKCFECTMATYSAGIRGRKGCEKWEQEHEAFNDVAVGTNHN